ncbi:MAG: hypothetical protein ACYC4U_16935 [Pirellulaceae bacterium]
MNRVIVLGVAIFFAFVGIVLVGGQQQAVAGDGCNGCQGAVACDGGNGGCAAVGCSGDTGRRIGRARCGARTRCEGRTRGEGRQRHVRRGLGRRGCGGQPADCCGEVVVSDCCGVSTESAAPAEAAPAESPPADDDEVGPSA